MKPKLGQAASSMYLCVCVTKKLRHVCMWHSSSCLMVWAPIISVAPKWYQRVVHYYFEAFIYMIITFCTLVQARKPLAHCAFCCNRPSFWNKLESIMFNQRQLKKHFQITLPRSHLSVCYGRVSAPLRDSWNVLLIDRVHGLLGSTICRVLLEIPGQKTLCSTQKLLPIWCVWTLLSVQSVTGGTYRPTSWRLPFLLNQEFLRAALLLFACILEFADFFDITWD